MHCECNNSSRHALFESCGERDRGIYSYLALQTAPMVEAPLYTESRSPGPGVHGSDDARVLLPACFVAGLAWRRLDSHWICKTGTGIRQGAGLGGAKWTGIIVDVGFKDGSITKTANSAERIQLPVAKLPSGASFQAGT